LKGAYSGDWASTKWVYIFDGNGGFEYIINGHFDNSDTFGTYEIKGDTVSLKANKTIKGTRFIRRRFLIDKDSCIIDLQMRYDYCKSRDLKYRKSNERNYKFPQTKTDNPKIISDLKTVLILTYTNPKVIAYLHFDDLPDRKLVFKPYYELNKSNFPDLKIGNQTVEFEQTELPNFYIEFADINQNKDRIEIKFEIKGEGVNSTIIYELTNGKWNLYNESYHEK
jgi:hypothetical protein